jgi:type VI secretion system protein ImpE
MNATELFRAGKLTEAIQALTEEVRQNPTDPRKRTFLFELLCFAGDFDRGEKHLDVLAQGGKNAELGALLYRAALHAERERRQFFESKTYLETGGSSAVKSPPGKLNGRSFQEIADADLRIGARLEIFVAGRYMWVPFEHIATLRMQEPKRLRDLLWAPALVTNGPSFKGRDLGEVMVPVLCPFSSTHSDDAVRLGRATVWEEAGGAEVPFGQKMLLVDGEEVPLLDVRELEFVAADSQAAAG